MKNSKTLTVANYTVEIKNEDGRRKVTDEEVTHVLNLLQKVVLKNKYCFSPKKIGVMIHNEIFKGDGERWISTRLTMETEKFTQVTITSHLDGWEIQSISTFDTELEIVFTHDL